MSGWYGVDLDGTLARYDHWRGPGHIGEPVQPMLDRVKEWIFEGKEVRIVTARAGDYPDDAEEFRGALKAWCRAHGLPSLEATSSKDFQMIELWDDRARSVTPNVGLDVYAAAREVARLTMIGGIKPFEHNGKIDERSDQALVDLCAAFGWPGEGAPT